MINFSPLKKVLVIRFSSIGDIVLTSPVLRCLKNTYPDATIHYLTKQQFASIVASNPAISKVYTITQEIDEVISELKEEAYDFVVDLHHNLRTFRLKQKLGQPNASFPKVNLQKFLLTTFKWDKMPAIHVVDRYFKAVEKLGVFNDKKGLDFFISEQDHVDIAQHGIKMPFIAFSIGAQFATKRLPTERIIELVSKINAPVVLLGGASDKENANMITAQSENVINLCGVLSLQESASVLQQAAKVVSHDTGLMHIASAFQKEIISIWGNTVPALGMYPYLPQEGSKYSIHEVKLSCRPCSKIGYQACPKKHFKCMEEQDLDAIAEVVNFNAQ
ncbi:MAG: glycosyl transferase [Crocinitomix sp.]|nr:glycosyl transferase [Crocinitomix sp.]